MKRWALISATVLTTAAVPVIAATTVGAVDPDVGDMPDTSRVLAPGEGGSITVNSELGATDDADLFQVCVGESGVLGVDLTGTTGLADTAVYVFEANEVGAVGIVSQDDADIFTWHPNLSATVEPGTYFVGISAYKTKPYTQRDGGTYAIFPPFGGDAVESGPLTSWSGTGSATGSYTAVFTGITGCDSAPASVDVDVDVKPGSEGPPTIKARSKGRTPVAILGSADLDVADIDPASVQVGGVAPATSAVEDVNGDGFDDLVVHVATAELALSIDATELCVTAAVTGGGEISGCDDIVVR